MAYYNELSFASGYYHIEYGIVTLDENIPKNIRDRFWETWPSFRKKVIETEKQGLFLSRYPFLPIEDEDPNMEQYLKWKEEQDVESAKS